MIFDLQRFGGGKGGVTYQTAEYTPTEWELKMQELQVQYTQEIMPNAKLLNTTAKELLVGSIGDEPLDYGLYLNKALERYDEAYAKLYAGAEWITQYLTEIDNRKDAFSAANAYLVNLDSLPGAVENVATLTNDSLKTLETKVIDIAKDNHNDLDSFTSKVFRCDKQCRFRLWRLT